MSGVWHLASGIWHLASLFLLHLLSLFPLSFTDLIDIIHYEMIPACHRIKLLIAIYLFLFGPIPPTRAQNLAPNPDFEDFSSCPDGLNIPGNPNFNCIPWRTGSAGTPDYFNACANPNDIGVPDNIFGWQQAISGEAYTGFYAIINS